MDEEALKNIIFCRDALSQSLTETFTEILQCTVDEESYTCMISNILYNIDEMEAMGASTKNLKFYMLTE